MRAGVPKNRMSAGRLRTGLLWFVLCGLAYAGFEHSLPPPELGAAAFAGVLGGLTGLYASAQGTAFAARFDWVPIFLVRLPGAVLYESWLLLGPVLVCALRERGNAPLGRYIALRIDPGLHDPESASRRVAVIFGASITPNAVPIFIDRPRQRLVLHQLAHRREPGAGDRCWPI